MKAKWGQRGEWYVVIQLILFGLIFFAPLLTKAVIQWQEPWTTMATALGLTLGVLGGLISLAGVLSLGRNLTAVPYPKDDAFLVESGVYRIVRHPIYSGIIFGAVGWSLLNHSTITLILALILFLFFDLKSRREEQWLCDKYQNYPDYQARVRKLIPLVY